jgi:seryl-tRNA synthetase
MLNIKEIRNNYEEIEKKLQTKEPDIFLKPIVDLDARIRQLKMDSEALRAQHKKISKEIGLLKREGKDASDLMNQVEGMRDQTTTLEKELTSLEEQFNNAMASLPNIPMDDIKVALDPKENVTVKEVGAKPSFDFEPLNHVQLNEKLNLFDFERGAKVSGTGWPTYKGLGARLEWALINYMLNVHVKNGFTQWIPPLLVHENIMYGSGQLPKFKGQSYSLSEESHEMYLVPTAEVVLNGLHSNEIIPTEELPLRYVAYTPCFRREAGAAGANERGLIRIHQFNKVEMFCFCKPEESADLFEKMVASAEEILQGLGLHYRNSLLVTGDMSFGAAKTLDVEVWLPGQNRYYEVSSVSNCTDFQARRSNIRYREDNEKPTLVNTLNGSGLATSRLMVALLENNQNVDGTINLPPVLQEALGIEVLGTK